MNSAFRLAYKGHVFAIEVILNYLRNGQLVLADDRIKEELHVRPSFIKFQELLRNMEKKRQCLLVLSFKFRFFPLRNFRFLYQQGIL